MEKEYFMIITIGGPPGSGKTTIAKLLSKRMKNMTLLFAGEIFRKLAEERGMSLEKFGELAEKDWSIDKRLDQKILKETTRRDNLIIDGRLAGVMLQKRGISAFKIWIDAPLQTRAERIASRDHISVEKAINDIQRREHSEKLRYKEIYDIDLDKNFSIYDMIIDSKYMKPREIINLIMKELYYC